MYFGVIYYPELWPERQRWELDARMMAELHFNVVRMGELIWSGFEPAPGRYTFEWMDEVVEIMYRNGVQTLFGTPTVNPPAWLVEKDPEVMVVDSSGRRRSYGSWGLSCVNNHTFRDYSERIVRTMAEHYKDNPAVLGWQVDNELCFRFEKGSCYCRKCAEKFHTWLRSKYAELDILNKTWGTVFWGQTYSSWEQIPLPVGPERSNSGLDIDFIRFSSDSLVDYIHMQAEIIRGVAPGHLITHNRPGREHHIDSTKLRGLLDYWSLDHYPGWPPPGEGDIPLSAAYALDFARGAKRKNFWMPEFQVNHLDGPPYPSPAPGQVRSWSYQAIARGGDMIIFYPWRGARSGAEQFLTGILNHDGTPSRLYAEVKTLGEELSRLAGSLDGTSPPQGRVAILNSFDSLWALKLQPHNNFLAKSDVWIYSMQFYRALYERNIPADIIAPTEDLSGYEMVIAPSLFMVNTEIVANLERYVAGGGLLVFGCRSGVKTWENQLVEESFPGPLRRMAGARVKEFVTLSPREDLRSFSPGTANSIKWVLQDLKRRGATPCELWCDILEPEGAKVVGRYAEDFFRGHAAITSNGYGKGTVIYVGTMGQPIPVIVEWLLRKKSIRPVMKAPGGTEVLIRAGKKHKLLFLINHYAGERKIELAGRWTDAFSGQKVSKAAISQFEARILKQTEGSKV